MESTEQNDRKLQAGLRLDADLYAVIERFRTEEDRSMSNMIERLLKTHPRIQPELESAEVATA
jgi:hypothetical protein